MYLSNPLPFLTVEDARLVALPGLGLHGLGWEEGISTKPQPAANN